MTSQHFRSLMLNHMKAEWCLETLEALFDHFYVGPAAAAKKKAALNEKLEAAGKRPAK
jgi:hypothetical protein